MLLELFLGYLGLIFGPIPVYLNRMLFSCAYWF